MAGCRHSDRVKLPDGTVVRAMSFDNPHARQTPPAYGLYFDPVWSPPWPHRVLEWPDFGLPADITELRIALDDLLARARRGKNVELGCLGGHGRTGTALACAAVLAGAPADEAVQWVRKHYCRHAVETAAQERLVAGFGR